MKLYHGTSSLWLESVLREGIKPRERTRVDNWKHTVGSNKKVVYLTDAYASYFALNAVGSGSPVTEHCVVLEIDSDRLDERLLCADEDAIEQTQRGNDKLGDWDMKRRTIYYRARAHLYSAEDSLRAMGTCAYRGTVPPRALTRYAVFDQGKAREFVWGGMDPFISTSNYKFMAEKYRSFHAWLFGDLPEWPMNPSLVRDGVRLFQYERQP